MNEQMNERWVIFCEKMGYDCNVMPKHFGEYMAWISLLSAAYKKESGIDTIIDHPAFTEFLKKSNVGRNFYETRD